MIKESLLVLSMLVWLCGLALAEDSAADTFIDDGIYSLYYTEDISAMDKFAIKTERHRLKYVSTFDLDDLQPWRGMKIADYDGRVSIYATKLWPVIAGTAKYNTPYFVKGDKLGFLHLENQVGLIIASQENQNLGLKTIWAVDQNRAGEWKLRSLGLNPQEPEKNEVVDFNYNPAGESYIDKNYGMDLNILDISGIDGLKLHGPYKYSRRDDSVRIIAPPAQNAASSPEDILVLQKSNVDVSFADPFGVRMSGYGGLPALKISSPEGKKLFLSPINVSANRIWLFKEPSGSLLASCSEDDSGRNIYIAGHSELNLSNAYGKFADRCDGNKLIEFHCDGRYLKKSVYECNCKANENICDRTRLPKHLYSEIVMVKALAKPRLSVITGLFSMLTGYSIKFRNT